MGDTAVATETRRTNVPATEPLAAPAGDAEPTVDQAEATATGRPVVLVTGASTGIGRASALHLASVGFDVLAGVRREQDAEALRNDGQDIALPGTLRTLLLDVTSADSIAHAAAAVRTAVGRMGLSGLVNNAGVAVNGPVEALPLDRWRAQFETNLFGTIAVTQAMLPLLRQRVGYAGGWSARIVMMSSVAGRVAQPLAGAYSASKAALEAVSDALRIELRRQKIHVCVIQPGAIRTPFWSKTVGPPGSVATQSLYHFETDRVRTAMDKTACTAIPPERVAYAVEACLSNRWPKRSSTVGLDATAGVLSRRFLPTRLFDRALRNFYKLP